jgi:DNA-binding phage protein
MPPRPADPIAVAIMKATVAAGLNTSSLARKAQVPRFTITRWFNGHTHAKTNTVCACLKALDLTITLTPAAKKRR